MYLTLKKLKEGFMKVKKIDHLGIAVESLEVGIAKYKVLLGKEPDHLEEVIEQKVKTAFFDVSGTNIELLEATDETSPIAKFIARNKRGGLHHICYEVEDIIVAIRELKSNGVQMIDDEPRVGAHNKLVAFIHPKSMDGVLIELSQSKK